MAFTLTSTVFERNGEIPARYTCEGENVSPPLSWSGAPAGTQGFVLVLEDPDAPDPSGPRMTWVHWTVYNIPKNITELPQAVRPEDLPAGAQEAGTDWMRPGYGGPCPPIGRHHYVFRLYALDRVLPAMHRARKAEVDRAMTGHILGQAVLVGTYKKRGCSRLPETSAECTAPRFATLR